MPLFGSSRKKQLDEMLRGMSPDMASTGGYVADPNENRMDQAPDGPVGGQPKPKFFGQGGAGRDIAGGIGDYLLQMAHMQPIYAPAMEHQRDMEQRSADRSAAMDQWIQQQKYEEAHRPPPAPTEFERTLMGAGVQPGTPEWQQAMQARQTDMQGNPLSIVPIPQGGTIGVVNKYTGQEVGAGGGGGTPQVSSAEEYNRLPPGSQYRDPQGHLRTKGGAASQGQAPFAAAGDNSSPAFRASFQHGSMTSGRRTPEGNVAVHGARGSNHIPGHAADYGGPDLPALRDEVAAYYGNNAKVAIHNGTHVHADLPNYQVPYFGQRGTLGLRRR